MRKIHVALVGGQPAPVFYGIAATSPDVVIFIYSRDSENALIPIKEKLTSNGICCAYEDYLPLNPTEPSSTLDCARIIKEKHSDDHLILNISGGTKSWAYLFSKTFEEHSNTTVIYVDQLNRLWNYSDYSFEQIKPLDLVQHLELYGNHLRNYSRFDSYTQTDKESVKILEEARSFNFNEFNSLTTVLSKEWNHRLQHMFRNKWETKTGSFVEWCKTGPTQSGWVRLFLKNKTRSEEFFIQSDHAVQLAFNSGWFEFKVAQLLSGWKEAKDILLNCRFKTKKNADKNEADIIIQTSNRLLFVECKTKLTKPTDIDKFKTVVSTYGGTAALGIFITDSPMEDPGREKCESVKLLPPFSYSSHCTGFSKEKALYTLLDTAIEQINR